MSDLDLGMNRWACDGFEYPDQDMDRGKVVRERDVFEAFEEFEDISMLMETGFHIEPYPVREWILYCTEEPATIRRSLL